jgi:hypothetical protein
MITRIDFISKRFPKNVVAEFLFLATSRMVNVFMPRSVMTPKMLVKAKAKAIVP